MTLLRDRDLFDLADSEHELHDLTGGVLTVVALAPMLRRPRTTHGRARVLAGAAVMAALAAGWRWLRRAATIHRQALETSRQTVNGTKKRADGTTGAGDHWRLMRSERMRYDHLNPSPEPPPASLAELVAEVGDLRARARALAGDPAVPSDDRERAESVAHALEHLGSLAAGGGIHGAAALPGGGDRWLN